MDKYLSVRYKYLMVKRRKIEFCRGRMCMHISANYGAICKSIWFYFGTLVSLHVLHILFKSQINILIRTKVINLFVFLP